MSAESVIARSRAEELLARGGRVAFPPDLGEPDLVAELPRLLGDAEAEVLVPHRVRAAELAGFGPRVTQRAIFGGRNVATADYAPLPLGRLPKLIDGGSLAVDVALVRLSPADATGMHSVGPSASLTADLVRSARHVIAEIDPDLPRTVGDTTVASEALTVQVPATQPLELPPDDDGERSQTALRIAEHVAPLIPDGAHLAVGIGGIAQAVIDALGDHRRLRLHSGLLSGGLMRLLESGATDGAWVPIVGEAIGPEALMHYIDGNKRLSFQSTRVVHDPRRLAAYDCFVTVNTVLAVDLMGCAGCESSRGGMRGGLGGLVDFLIGAQLSERGRGILALPSTTSDGSSRIRPLLAADEAGIPGYLVDYVVTEWGVADLRAATRRECAERLIAIAHPDHRAVLSHESGDPGCSKPSS